MSRPIDLAWLELLGDVLSFGRPSSPRGKATLEIPQRTIAYDARRCVITTPERKLNYKFMAAEAHWMLSGDDSVAGVAPWNKHIAQFSDDGVKFFGAYGPKLSAQLPYVVATLASDLDSRQAGLTFWRESPPKTKDVPCTVAAFFRTRERAPRSRFVDGHFFMRSSDAWLGVPYDAFNFSMITHLVAGSLRFARVGLEDSVDEVMFWPGVVYLTMASSHLYEMGPDGVSQWDAARKLLAQPIGSAKDARYNESPLWWSSDPGHLLEDLRELRDTSPGDSRRWWEVKT